MMDLTSYSTFLAVFNVIVLVIIFNQKKIYSFFCYRVNRKIVNNLLEDIAYNTSILLFKTHLPKFVLRNDKPYLFSEDNYKHMNQIRDFIKRLELIYFLLDKLRLALDEILKHEHVISAKKKEKLYIIRYAIIRLLAENYYSNCKNLYEKNYYDSSVDSSKDIERIVSFANHIKLHIYTVLFNELKSYENLDILIKVLSLKNDNDLID